MSNRRLSYEATARAAARGGRILLLGLLAGLASLAPLPDVVLPGAICRIRGVNDPLSPAQRALAERRQRARQYQAAALAANARPAQPEPLPGPGQ